MNKKQNESEMLYRLTVMVLDAIFERQSITVDEYDHMRSYLARELAAPFGLLESEDMLWKKEL